MDHKTTEENILLMMRVLLSVFLFAIYSGKLGFRAYLSFNERSKISDVWVAFMLLHRLFCLGVKSKGFGS